MGLTNHDDVLIRPYDFSKNEYETKNPVYGLTGFIIDFNPSLNQYKVRVPYPNNAGYIDYWFDEKELTKITMEG